MNYAEIAVHYAINGAFTYQVPEHLAGRLAAGHLVRVPFRTGQEAGIITRITDQEPDFSTKPILDLLDPQPVITTAQLALAEWLAANTLTPIGNCLWLMLPPGYTPTSTKLYLLRDPHAEGVTPQEVYLISLLKRRGGMLTESQLNQKVPKENREKLLQGLIARGILDMEAALAPPRVKPKIVRTVQLAENHLDYIGTRLGKESRRATALEVLWRQGAMPLHQLTLASGCPENRIKTLAKDGWVTLQGGIAALDAPPEDVYQYIIELRDAGRYMEVLTQLAEADGVLDVPSLSAQTGVDKRALNRLADEGLIVFGESEVWRNSLAEKVFVPDAPPPFTAAQSEAWQQIQTHMDDPIGEVFLLHGVTGSGKTEIYMRAVQHALAQGRGAIVLVPEIALTAQMVKRFAQRFSGKVALIHSTLSGGERFDTWRRIRQGEIQVVIGARSALFAPLPDVGVVVLDEEHDDSYKQSPPFVLPFYHARSAAIAYMKITHGTVILGSATPDVTTYFNAKRGNYRLLELPNRVMAHQSEPATQKRIPKSPNIDFATFGDTQVARLPLPPVHVVDMRHELRMGHTSIFSRQLITSLNEVLALGQQAILFLNRRGTATFVFCRDCGYIAKCKHCDTPLTYHRVDEELLCHHCGHHQANPHQCPQCRSSRIKYFGRGTEQIEAALRAEFPHACVLRWDQDTATQRNAHERIYEAFSRREADILVGTQMIAKGLDLPLVTLVGIISADTALGLPDYRMGETTFQLLTQVAGRAGRSLLGGRVILQTYQPNHYAIRAAALHDYATFYTQEISYRQQLHWTPFIRLGRVLFRHYNEEKTIAEAERFAETLRGRIDRHEFSASEVIGPVPCFFRKEDRLYRWHILVRTTDPVALFDGLNPGQYGVLDIDPLDIL